MQPWLNVKEFKKQLEGVEIDTSTKSVALVLRDLKHGAEIEATDRARLPTNEKIAWLAYEYGDCLQEALEELILQGAMSGPLFEKEIHLDNVKVHAMGTKIKPNGKVVSLVDFSKLRLEFEGTAGYMYSPGYAGSLNSTIENSQFRVNLTSIREFVGRL